jgi:hypothetical protein
LPSKNACLQAFLFTLPLVVFLIVPAHTWRDERRATSVQITWVSNHNAIARHIVIPENRFKNSLRCTWTICAHRLQSQQGAVHTFAISVWSTDLTSLTSAITTICSSLATSIENAATPPGRISAWHRRTVSSISMFNQLMGL